MREDEVTREDGATGVYGVVDKPDFALVIPRDEHGLWLVEQYRYPVRRRAWEFPQGSWGAGASGCRADLAAAELREETGLHAAELRHLGHLYEAYGFCSQGFDVYLATGGCRWGGRTGRPQNGTCATATSPRPSSGSCSPEARSPMGPPSPPTRCSCYLIKSVGRGSACETRAHDG